MKAAHAWNSHFLVVDKPPGGPVQLKWELLGPETITDPLTCSHQAEQIHCCSTGHVPFTYLD